MPWLPIFSFSCSPIVFSRCRPSIMLPTNRSALGTSASSTITAFIRSFKRRITRVGHYENDVTYDVPSTIRPTKISNDSLPSSPSVPVNPPSAPKMFYFWQKKLQALKFMQINVDELGEKRIPTTTVTQFPVIFHRYRLAAFMIALRLWRKLQEWRMKKKNVQ